MRRYKVNCERHKQKIDTKQKFKYRYIDNETITDDKVISNHFNKFISSITGILVRKIPNTTKIFDSYLNEQSENPFPFHLYHQVMLKH